MANSRTVPGAQGRLATLWRSKANSSALAVITFLRWSVGRNSKSFYSKNLML